jgi:Na+-translocating ferredoxin:NAD+ oxidoreductase RnfA subunit
MIAAIPSDNPQRDMSLLHSLYAFGTFTMIIISTAFLKLFGTDNWTYLIIFLAFLPLIAAVLFMISPMPDMNGGNSKSSSSGDTKRRAVGLALCVACIFFGSCAECAMGNWISTYMENALGISKTVGDILGAAMFAILLGIARITYAKFGKSITRTLLISMIGASLCYLVVGLSSNVVVAFIACITTGLFVSMLWPGTLIMMEEKIPNAGVAAFALMASGGDLGASVSPQLLGIVVDKVSATSFATNLGNTLNISAEQVGLKAGMLVTALFPIVGIAVVLYTVITPIFAKAAPRMYARIGKLFPLAAFNNLVIGVALICNHSFSLSLFGAIGLALGCCVGFVVLSYLTAEGIERVDNPDIPAAFRGLPILFLYVGLLALAVMGFSSSVSFI